METFSKSGILKIKHFFQVTFRKVLQRRTPNIFDHALHLSTNQNAECSISPVTRRYPFMTYFMNSQNLKVLRNNWKILLLTNNRCVKILHVSKSIDTQSICSIPFCLASARMACTPSACSIKGI